MKTPGPEHIGDILKHMQATTPLGLTLEHARIWENWTQLAGEHLAKHCRPHSVQDGQLRIMTDSTVWMHKISYVKWDLLRRINLMAKKELISDIFFLLDSDEPEKKKGRKKKKD